MNKINYADVYAISCYCCIVFIAVMHIGVIIESANIFQRLMNLASLFACFAYALFAITLPRKSLGNVALLFAAISTLMWI